MTLRPEPTQSEKNLEINHFYEVQGKLGEDLIPIEDFAENLDAT